MWGWKCVCECLSHMNVGSHGGVIYGGAGL